MAQYTCPMGCVRNGKPIPIESVRGWKKHMTRKHGQWSEDQLAQIVGAAPIDQEHGRSLFLAEADDTPGLEPDAREKTSSEGTSDVDGNKDTPAPEPKRVALKSKKLRKLLAQLPDLFLKSKGIVPDETDKEIIDGATEMLEEMFGISIEVPDTQWTIKSRWIALLFPLGAMLLVWAKHILPIKMAEEKAKAEAEQPPTQ